ncbi:TMEM43 family protein [Patescibacteria group bacterium]|nr:TMEM43 family protein [Patescibacteria group bacterium]
MQSVGGVLLGIVLFFSSFGVLFWNEGRVDLSKIAKKAEVVSAGQVDANKNGVFASVSGEVTTDSTLGDGLYLAPGMYLSISRIAEIYAWEEDSKSETTTNTGGSETTTTTYTYEKAWTSDPQDSSEFQEVTGHENQVQTQTETSLQTESINVGAWAVDGRSVDLPGGEQLTLNEERVTLPAGAQISGGYVYLNGADPALPDIGDERVKYTALMPGFDGTIFGEVDGANGQIARYTDKNGNAFYRIFEGGRDEALATMHGEYVMALWIFRFVGFLMMWIGLSMVFGPISALLDILPIFGRLSRTLIGGVTFLIAGLLSIVTILVSMILHSLVALIIAVLLIIGGIIGGLYWYKNNKMQPVVTSA